MPTLRSLTAGVLLALTVLGAGAATVLAAPAESGRSELADAWCFDDITLVYCTEIDGFFSVVVTPDGSGKAVTHLRSRTVITDASGAYVGEYAVRTQDQFRYSAEGDVTMHEVTHTSARFDGMTCTGRSVLRIADFEVRIDHSTVSCH